MSDSEAPEPRKLTGAAAAAVAKRAAGQPPAPSVTEWLAGITSGIAEKTEEARREVREAEEKLAAARHTLRALEHLQRFQNGELELAASEPSPARPRAPGAPRTPRAEGVAMQGRITATLKEASSDGLSVASLIAAVAPGGDAKEGQRVRNQLAQMVKKGAVGRDARGLYQLPA